jgi:glycosyltransferase involved in cell wall biosynthesis
MPDLPRPTNGSLRIVHCLRAPIGGLLRNVLDLAREQSRVGHRVGIIIDSTSGNAFEARRIADAAPDLVLGVTRLAMARNLSPTDLACAYSVFRTASALKPDVLHGHGAKGGTFARLVGSALALRGSPVARIYTPHGGSLHYRKASLKGCVYFTLERLLERLCDAIVHVSSFEADVYVDKVGLARCGAHVIVNGLQDEEFERIVPAEQARDLVFMGTLRDIKGADVLIRALGRLRDREGHAPTLALIGDGPDRDRCAALVEELGLSESVSFHASLPTREGLAQGRVMVVPSRAESMPYIVLETVAAGLPIIATRVGGIPEILGSEDLVEPGDAGALADAIRRVLDDPDAARDRAEAARHTLRERFTVATMAAAVERLYRAALSLQGSRIRAARGAGITPRPVAQKVLQSVQSAPDRGAR